MCLMTKTVTKYVNVSKTIPMSASATASRTSLLDINVLQ